jgi:membrane-bound lytic murein transglycosylase A
LPPPPPEPEYRGRLAAAAWQDLTDWRRESVRPSIEPFVRSCTVLEKQDPWKAACAAARSIAPGASEAEAIALFETHLVPWQAVNADETTSGMVTGYYEPLLHGSRTASKRFRYPIYAVPSDLLVIDLSSVYPEFKNRRLRGRIEGNRVVPYLARGDIDRDASPPLKGNELVWVDDAVDLFFLHIQGSGQVELENGERVRVGYADQNGHPFRSLGGLLIRRGEIPPERASMQGIKDWARRNPKRVQEFMNANPSYVFFRELSRDLPGPLGALGVPLTAERSIAVDPRVVPLGGSRLSRDHLAEHERSAQPPHARAGYGRSDLGRRARGLLLGFRRCGRQPCRQDAAVRAHVGAAAARLHAAAGDPAAPLTRATSRRPRPFPA